MKRQQRIGWHDSMALTNLFNENFVSLIHLTYLIQIPRNHYLEKIRNEKHIIIFKKDKIVE